MQVGPWGQELQFFCGILGGLWLFLGELQRLAGYTVSLEEEAPLSDSTKCSCGHLQGNWPCGHSLPVLLESGQGAGESKHAIRDPWEGWSIETFRPSHLPQQSAGSSLGESKAPSHAFSLQQALTLKKLPFWICLFVSVACFHVVASDSSIF